MEGVFQADAYSVRNMGPFDCYPSRIHDATCQGHCKYGGDSKILPHTIPQERQRSLDSSNRVCCLTGIQGRQVGVNLLDTLFQVFRVVQ